MTLFTFLRNIKSYTYKKDLDTIQDIVKQIVHTNGESIRKELRRDIYNSANNIKAELRKEIYNSNISLKSERKEDILQFKDEFIGRFQHVDEE